MFDMGNIDAQRKLNSYIILSCRNGYVGFKLPVSSRWYDEFGDSF